MSWLRENVTSYFGYLKANVTSYKNPVDPQSPENSYARKLLKKQARNESIPKRNMPESKRNSPESKRNRPETYITRNEISPKRNMPESKHALRKTKFTDPKIYRIEHAVIKIHLYYISICIKYTIFYYALTEVINCTNYRRIR